MSKNKKSSVGGQALIEGVMMRGVKKAAMAVRTPSGEIDVEVWDLKKPSVFSKIPIIRGVVNFISSIVMGYSCLSKSAERAGVEEETNQEPSKFEKFIEDKFGDKIMGVVVVLGVLLGVLASILLFMMLPSLIVKGINLLIPLGGFKALAEGVIKIIIFLSYLALVSKMEDIRRVFEYHGAEHKTIFCYEAGLPLTIENVKKQSRFHPRCGTSFLIIILVLSILIFSLPIVSWESILIRTLIKLALMPVVMGIAYEFIKLAGRYDNVITRAISWPGLKTQRLTTKEPDASQIEVAIAAFLPCISQEERDFYEVKPEIVVSSIDDDIEDLNIQENKEENILSEQEDLKSV